MVEKAKKLQVVRTSPQPEKIIGGEDCRKRTELGPNALMALRKIDAFAKAEADVLKAAEHRRENFAANGRSVH